MTAPLVCDEVTFVRDGRTILDAVTWRVDAGQRWALLGPNGAGKTSLLRIASTYELPSWGTIHVLGRQLGRYDVWKLRPRIGYASAALVRQLRPELTALEAIATGANATLAMARNRPDAAAFERAESLLVDGGLAHRRDTRLQFLSEGERQRVQLARTLMADAELLLLDEPTAGLDLGGREQLVQQLAKLPEGRTAVFVTHHLEEIPPCTTHVAMLAGGRLFHAGPIVEVLTGETLSACFGVPITVEHRDGRWFAWSR